MGHQGSHANGGGQLAVCVTGDITHTLRAEGFDASEDGTGRGQPIVAAIAGTLGANHGNVKAEHAWTGQLAAVGMAVRRLTPRECERLQGFPDDYTLIPMGLVSQVRAEKILASGDPARQDDAGNWWKMAADGPRYKALGNSWAVPNVVWIGHRIDQALRDVA
jgi:DNA (cytosine-5)-methyltransferase 1